LKFSQKHFRPSAPETTTTVETTTVDTTTVEEPTPDSREAYLPIIQSLSGMLLSIQIDISPLKTKDPACYASCVSRLTTYMVAVNEAQLNLLVYTEEQDLMVLNLMYTNILSLTGEWAACKKITKTPTTTKASTTTTKLYPSESCELC
jgi:hypothetical protein